MSRDVRIEVNSRAVDDLLRNAMLPIVEEKAERIAAAAGEGHEVHATAGRKRARAVVVTASFEAKHAEATGRNLTRAIDAGR